MKKLPILLMSLILCSVLPTKAQVSIGPQVGLNLANCGGDVTDNHIRFRPQAGAILNVDIVEMFSLQLGAMYSGKGTTFDYGGGDKDAITLEYISVPFNGVLNIDIGTGKLQIFGGIYMGYLFDAKYKYLADENNYTEDYLIGTSSSDEIKPIDLGFNIGLGLRFGKIQIQGGYSGSFQTISNYENDDVLNSVISMTFAYYINSPREKKSDDPFKDILK